MPNPVKCPCIVCKLHVKNNEPKGSICCSVCARWQHNACCPRLTPAAVEFFDSTHKLLGFHYWACDGCTVGYAKLNQRIGNLTTKVELLDKAVTANTASNKATNDKVEVIEKEVDSIKVARKQDKHDIIKEAKKAWSEEQRERESRKGNIVLYGLPEAPPSVTSGILRKKADENEAGALFRAIKVRVNNDDVKFAVRLGAMTEDIMDNPRPLRLSLRSQQLRECIFENARHLPKTRFNHVSIIPDLTTQQRDEDSELRDEATRLNNEMSAEDSLNWIYRCTGRRGERVIAKLKVRAGPPGRQDQRRPTSTANPAAAATPAAAANPATSTTINETNTPTIEPEPQKNRNPISSSEESEVEDPDQDPWKRPREESSTDTSHNSSPTSRTRTQKDRKKKKKNNKHR